VNVSDAGQPDPAAAGMRADALARVVDLARTWSDRGQLYIEHRGRVAVQTSFGCTPDSLFWLFSASKPFIAVLVHRYVERGLIDLDAPVARYWPEFGDNGKQHITVRQALQHRTGMPTAGSALGDALAMSNWRRSVSRIERSAPKLDPSDGPAYQYLIYGFLLGELLQRVTGEQVDELLRREILEPLGLHDTYIGLPDDAWHRRIRVHVDGPGGGVAQSVLNRRVTRAAVIPAAGVSTTAVDLGIFYRALLDDLAGTGPGLLRRETLLTALEPSSERQADLWARAPIRWSAGFQLGGVRFGSRTGPMGRTTSALAFGHNGSNCCIAWADPKRDLIVSYLTDRVPRAPAGIRHLAQISDAIIAACSD
jgi:CubicO group peptidase (beta-lactamase class C family)